MELNELHSETKITPAISHLKQANTAIKTVLRRKALMDFFQRRLGKSTKDYCDAAVEVEGALFDLIYSEANFCERKTINLGINALLLEIVFILL